MSRTPKKKPISKSAWLDPTASHHDVALASALDRVVTIKLPDLPELVSSGDFPNHLVDTAIQVANGAKVTREHLAEQAEFYRELISKTLVDPALTPDEVKALPYEDKELIAAIATRQRDVDALGNQIAGLDKSDQWREFRGLDILD
jgi:hypothetical protein